jgi:hypothetical protein
MHVAMAEAAIAGERVASASSSCVACTTVALYPKAASQIRTPLGVQ